MNDQDQVALWDAVNEYAESCNGDTSDVTLSVRRMHAVAHVERAIGAVELVAEARMSASLEAGVRGAAGIYPDWVYESRNAIRHHQENVPWLPDLLKILGWQGGTVHQALAAVARLVEKDIQTERVIEW